MAALLLDVSCDDSNTESARESPKESSPPQQSPRSEHDRTILQHVDCAGEVTETTVLLQARLITGGKTANGDIIGAPGFARFRYGHSRDLANSKTTDWLEAAAARDFLIRSKVQGLQPRSKYYYRVELESSEPLSTSDGIGSFQTLGGSSDDGDADIIITGCMNLDWFYFSPKAYRGPDRDHGYPALNAILELTPQCVVATGDSVYYDSSKPVARTQEQLRRKWHMQFAMPRLLRLMSVAPYYWMKDDHDYRFNDADPFRPGDPSAKLGRSTFLEQVPVTDSEGSPTYRTHRITRHLQIWLLEGRDHRSPNSMPNGPEKSLWGKDQRSWLLATLLESDATFKVVINPTPLIGPDDANDEGGGGPKRDNHTQPAGFLYERDAFFSALEENQVHPLFVCGDRHWQYHSISPEGYHEFSVGSLTDSSARMGVKPGDMKSTDPSGKIEQAYSSITPSGGFLRLNVSSGLEETRCKIIFYDTNGTIQYHWESE